MKTLNEDKYILLINLRRLSKENIETFLSAKRLGYKIVLIAQVLPQQFEDYIDKFYQADTSKEENVFLVAKDVFEDIKISGILPSSETNVAIVSRLANKYNLPGMPVDSIDNSRIKSAMREAGKNNRAVAIRNRVIQGVNGLREAADYVGYPLIIKPANGMGSAGIFTVHHKNELSQFSENYKNIVFANSGSPDDLEYIIEEYLEGQEVCIDGIISKGQVTVFGIGDKWTTDTHHLEYFGMFPSSLPQNAQKEIIDAVKSIIHDFGFDNCTFHMEGKVGPNGFKMIEVGARPGGDHIISHVIRMITGINGFEEAIKVCVGEHSAPIINYNGFSAIRYLLAEQEGTLKGYENLEEAINVPEVEYIIPEVSVGSAIKFPPKCFRSQKLINFIGRSNNYEHLKNKMNQVVGMVNPIIVKETNEL